MKRKICVISAVLVVLIFAVSFITYYPVRTFIEAKILLTDDIKKERSKNSLTEFNARRVRIGGAEVCIEESIYSEQLCIQRKHFCPCNLRCHQLTR
mgnify:CR=1 FL=1